MAEAKTTPEKLQAVQVDSDDSDDEETFEKHSGVSTFFISILESSQSHL